jgi:hypothetical protein
MGILCGIIAGVWLASSMQVGAAFGTSGHAESDWTILQWGDHWMWRAVASLVATSLAAFVAGMVARRRGSAVGILSALPTTLYWAFISYSGWTGHLPGSDSPVDVSLGYRIVASLLVLATLPLAAGSGKEGVAYGRANAVHFDSRRGSLLGIRWYHFLWLPVLIHLMIITAAFGVIYGFQWVVVAWRNGFSFLGFIPFLFVMAMLGTLQLLATGAMRTYEALAGFDDTTGMSVASVARRVLKFGFGYTLATIAAQGVISVVHFGLNTLIHKLFG